MNKLINESINDQLTIIKCTPKKNKIVFVGPEGIGKSHGILYWVIEQNEKYKNEEGLNKVFYFQYSEELAQSPFKTIWTLIK